ncbi:MAG: immune inhibitor A [candidate division Zixibacteria bacterium]|nr:immune inhibitor A [candidate division Zixibacteria bacterium]
MTERFADEWHVETYQRHGGTSSWKCGGIGSVNYADASDGGLVTPPIRLAPNSQLRFWHLMSAECGATPPSAWDGGILMISNDGVEWTKIYPELGYTHSTAGSGSNLNFDGSDGLFSGAGDWSEAVFNLTAWSGNEVRLMFRFDSDGAMTVGGWYVDDLWIGNTDEGLNVKVKAAEGLDITFSIAGGRGNTWADEKTTGPALPPPYTPVAEPTPTFYYPVTTAPFMNAIGISLAYEESQLQSPENDLVLLAYYDGTWHDVTTSRLVDENRVTGSVDVLCPLVLAERLSCCVGRVGNANGLGNPPNEVTISDIQLLVTAKFISSLPCEQNLSCLAEADVNQSGEATPACKDITIADIQTLVNHLFIAGPTNAPLKECL